LRVAQVALDVARAVRGGVGGRGEQFVSHSGTSSFTGEARRQQGRRHGDTKCCRNRGWDWKQFVPPPTYHTMFSRKTQTPEADASGACIHSERLDGYVSLEALRASGRRPCPSSGARQSSRTQWTRGGRRGGVRRAGSRDVSSIAS